nr:hypothetical protein [Escherichia coli]
MNSDSNTRSLCNVSAPATDAMDIDFSTDKEPAIRNLDWPPESPDNQYHLNK